ncbi:hypothetical protein GCM10007242_45240 [Pigmentiphaga litoralis]|uniref:hypothetical protein n=1 Tax=Pigmentiphaga litoralis TaxID=516702 RepID=UPI00167798DF|nr:hypothetical protein [Pigmentiphaga litoralis]GGX33110.1 hypothetical protein GCM10007242_45240 [Pigmentiphaga litoralis]
MTRPLPRAACLDPSFKYTHSSETDIRKTFKRLERQMKKQARAADDVASEQAPEVPQCPTHS